MKHKKNSGFTLLELLIVIAILAVLSVALVLVLNPAETLKKSRDAQRISDLSTLKTAIGLYLTSVTTPQLAGGNWSAATTCQSTVGTWASGNKMYYSYPNASGGGGAITNGTTIDGTATATLTPNQVQTPSLVDGNGWLPINFNSIAGGSPISNLPVDPVNTVATLSAPKNSDLVYRFACSQSPIAYEIDATLESEAYKVTDNKLTSDGGNSTNYYETGTNLLIIGKTAAGTDF